MFKLIVSHGAQKHKLSFETAQPTSADLSEKVAVETGIISSKQKLIHKGKKLEIGDVSLPDLGVSSGSKLMLLGCKINPEEESFIKRIEKVKLEADKVKANIIDLGEQLTGIKDGYLPEEVSTEALNKIHKQCIGSVEKLMKLLEDLDSVQATEEIIRKMKRNQIVAIQATLSECDKLMEQL